MLKTDKICPLTKVECCTGYCGWWCESAKMCAIAKIAGSMTIPEVATTAGITAEFSGNSESTAQSEFEAKAKQLAKIDRSVAQIEKALLCDIADYHPNDPAIIILEDMQVCGGGVELQEAAKRTVSETVARRKDQLRQELQLLKRHRDEVQAEVFAAMSENSDQSRSPYGKE